MPFSEVVTIIVGIIAIVGSAISIGTWLGLKRAESKRIVRAEMAIVSFRDEMEKYRERIESRLDLYEKEADMRYARKDVVETTLVFMRQKQNEISEDVKEIKKKVEKL